MLATIPVLYPTPLHLSFQQEMPGGHSFGPVAAAVGGGGGGDGNASGVSSEVAGGGNSNGGGGGDGMDDGVVDEDAFVDALLDA